MLGKRHRVRSIDLTVLQNDARRSHASFPNPEVRFQEGNKVIIRVLTRSTRDIVYSKWASYWTNSLPGTSVPEQWEYLFSCDRWEAFASGEELLSPEASVPSTYSISGMKWAHRHRHLSGRNEYPGAYPARVPMGQHRNSPTSSCKTTLP
jgi:hypothetical protein